MTPKYMVIKMSLDMNNKVASDTAVLYKIQPTIPAVFQYKKDAVLYAKQNSEVNYKMGVMAVGECETINSKKVVKIR